MARRVISPVRPSSFDRPWPLWFVAGLGLVMLACAMWRWRAHPAPSHRPSGQAIGLIVDINHADGPTLAALPGLGPATARLVLQSRKTQGRFENVEAITRIRGIGPGKLKIMRPLITCGPGVTIIEPASPADAEAQKKEQAR